MEVKHYMHHSITLVGIAFIWHLHWGNNTFQF